MNSVLNKYLVFGFLKVIYNVTLVFICLGIILNLFEEIEFFKNLDVGLEMPFFLTLMFIPNLIIKLMPFIIFIASMWFIIHIRSNNDLLSLKVFGYSNFKIIVILAFTSFIFGFFILFAINPVTSSMVKYYEQTKAEYSKYTDHLISINQNGMWIKENEKNGFRIITAKEIKQNFLYDVTIYRLNKNYKILERIESKKANIENNIWEFEKVSILNLEENEEKLFDKTNYKFQSIYNVEKLSTLYKNLDTVSFLNLLTSYDKLEKKGYKKETLNEKMHIFISMPIFLFLMVVLASIFSIGSVKKSQNLHYIFVSIITCVVVYYFKDLSVALGQTNRISLITAVWIPIISISLFCTAGIIQINEK